MAVEELVWEFFRIDPMYVSGNFLTDIVGLIIVPSILLLIFLDSAASFFLRGNTKFQHLTALAFFLIIVIQGFYGPFAVMAYNYTILFIIFAAGAFFMSRFVGERGLKVLEVAGTAAGQKAQSRAAKAKIIKELEAKGKFLQVELQKAERQFRATKDRDTRAYLAAEISRIRADLMMVRDELIKLKLK